MENEPNLEAKRGAPAVSADLLSNAHGGPPVGTHATISGQGETLPDPDSLKGEKLPRRSSTYSCGGCGPGSFAPSRVPICTSPDRTSVPHPRCAGNAWRWGTRGRHFGCACCVVTSDVATNQRTSTPESISAKQAIP